MTSIDRMRMKVLTFTELKRRNMSIEGRVQQGCFVFGLKAVFINGVADSVRPLDIENLVSCDVSTLQLFLIDTFESN